MRVLEYVREGGSILELEFEEKYRSGDLIVETSNLPLVSRCSKCSRIRPSALFLRDRRAADGRQSACRECANADRRARYATDPEHRARKLASATAERRAAGAKPAKRLTEADRRASRAASNRAWNKANPDRRRELARQWQEANPERKREHKRADYRRNKESYVKRALRRNQALRSAEQRVILDRERARIYSSPCAACGNRDRIELDHIIPISRGGRHSIGNVQPLCRSCNASKGAKLLAEWKRDRR